VDPVQPTVVRGAERHVPNILTGLRLVAIPFFIALELDAPGGHSWPAGLLFAAASLTDWFDGYLARRLDVSTRFGRLADPLADRLLIASAVVLLWHHGRVPLLILALVIGRDLLLVSGFSVAADRGYELSVLYLGKTATFVLMTGLGLIMFSHPGATVPDVVLDVGVVLSLAAGAVYVVTVARRLRR
jgi:CDP-diacylglycerol--glycerol-3-phosphate 3-phosphatidyltransferase